MPDLFENEIDCRRMRQSCKMSNLAVEPLAHGIVRLRRHSSRYRNILPASFAEQSIRNLRSAFGVAESCRDAQNLYLRAAQRQRHGKGVINVVTDVSVEDDLFALGRTLCE